MTFQFRPSLTPPSVFPSGEAQIPDLGRPFTTLGFRVCLGAWSTFRQSDVDVNSNGGRRRSPAAVTAKWRRLVSESLGWCPVTPCSTPSACCGSLRHRLAPAFKRGSRRRPGLRWPAPPPLPVGSGLCGAAQGQGTGAGLEGSGSRPGPSLVPRTPLSNLCWTWQFLGWVGRSQAGGVAASWMGISGTTVGLEEEVF